MFLNNGYYIEINYSHILKCTELTNIMKEKNQKSLICDSV